MRWPKLKRPSAGFLVLAALNVISLLAGGTAFLVQADIINPVSYAAVSTAVCNYYNSGSSVVSFGCPGLSTTSTGQGISSFGYTALAANTTGAFNTAFGDAVLNSNTTGNNSSAFGYQALQAATALGNAASNNAFGFKALYSITTGQNNTAFGNNAGQYITGGSTANQTSSSSVYLGNGTQASANGDTNEIVIGQAVTGEGSNTATIGTATETKAYVGGGVCPGNATAYGTACLYGGTGAPTFLAPNGSLYMRYDGGTGSRLYGNTSGASTSGTTWTALASP